MQDGQQRQIIEGYRGGQGAGAGEAAVIGARWPGMGALESDIDALTMPRGNSGVIRQQESGAFQEGRLGGGGDASILLP